MSAQPAETLKAGYTAATSAAALFDISDCGKLLFSGPDCVSFLDSVISADIKPLVPGSGRYATLLEPKGKYLADLIIFRIPEGVLISTAPGESGYVSAEILRYRFRAKVTLEDLTASLALFSLQGPEVQQIAQGAGVPAPPSDDLSIVSDAAGGVRWAARKSDWSGPGLWIWASAADAPDVHDRLIRAGASGADESVLSILRVEAGIPTWGRDIDQTIIPMEALQERALSFSKCYPGQEVISRIHFRGHVNRMLQRFTLESESLPPANTPLFLDGKEVGHLRSAVRSPLSGQIKALGYLRREQALSGQAVEARWDGHSVRAVPAPLPYQPAGS